MRAAGLLERLKEEDEGRGHAIASLAAPNLDSQSYIDAIKANIGRVLNERRGASPASPDFGLADFNDGATESDDMSKYICEDIVRCIKDFEPRVVDVKAKALTDTQNPLNLTYQLILQVRHREGDDPLRFEVHLGQGGAQIL